jgi:Sulfatase
LTSNHMNTFFSFLRSRPFFLILLPLFFVFHGFVDNYNAIPFRDVLPLLLMYLLVSLLFFFLGWIFFRQTDKAAFFSFCVMAFHFFFGAVQDLLKNYFGDSFITRYSFLLPVFSTAFVLLVWLLKTTTKPLIKWRMYLNLLFCVLIFIDAVKLTQEVFHRFSATTKNLTDLIKCDTCVKPDIYFLVFDEYSSSTAIKEVWQYDNTDLDAFLTKKGFRLLPFSRSNYNFSEFSIASTLNMDYLSIPIPSACTIKDYNNRYEEIKSNKVCSALSSIGYDIVNYSIFDIKKNPSPVKEDFLPLKTRLITSQTFISRIKKDLFHLLLVGKFQIKWLSKNLIYTTYHNNQKIIGLTLDNSADRSGQPRFVYSHIEMPHPPFYFNKYGQLKSKEVIAKEFYNLDPAAYLDYLPKTNEVIKKIVNSILGHAKRPVAIVLIGDHGFRSNEPKNFHFRNLNAVYLSSGDYKGFYDSITNVNEYRVLFNNLFNTSLPLKKDSTVFLVDKH